MRFEVTSIKPYVGELKGSVQQDGSIVEDDRLASLPGGVFRARSVSLRDVVAFAYGAAGHSLNEEQVIGGPSWAGSDKFSVDARAARATSDQDMRAMVRNLLSERFRLQTHPDRRSVAGLVVAQSGDAEPNSRLRPSTLNCEDPDSSKQNADCQWYIGAKDDAYVIEVRGRTIGSLLNRLTTLLGQPMTDETELSGRYDFRIAIPLPSSPASLDSASLIAAAMKSQLGLSVSRRSRPIDVVVIDSAERPTPD
jgi:uncharacterized protein (TIGR03435 family)